ncbi:hypothetical protein [uncultured Cocleimonas sp.]|uniref:hypothetical protein n=1 Tax=uncultured Cocleimonas sp. TaxID=1051587 RepID=UPI0026338EC5|nr:hypothetical protein [uncultured Cocleimonas sp.]
MTDFASGFEIKIPHGSACDVFSIRHRFIAKGELKLAASAHLPNASGAVGGVTTNSVIEINREREISAGRSIEVAISERVKAGFSAGINLNEIDNVLEQIATDGECRASHFSPLVSGLNASIGFGNTSLSLGWDSDLCFVSIKGSLPLKIGNESIVPEATFQLGLHEYMWWRLFNKIAAKYPSTSRFILKIESILGSMFGGRTVTMARFLSGAFANMQRLAPFMWAIDIALAVRDLTFWMTRRAARQGYRSGQLVAFGTSFTKTIFNYPLNFETGEVGELQRHAAAYAHRYHGTDRVAVQRYLSLFYNDARSIDNSANAQSVGIRLGKGMDALSDEAAAAPPRRPSNGRTNSLVNGSYSRQNTHISRQINNYFYMNIEHWVRDWRTQ